MAWRMAAGMVGRTFAAGFTLASCYCACPILSMLPCKYNPQGREETTPFIPCLPHCPCMPVTLLPVCPLYTLCLSHVPACLPSTPTSYHHFLASPCTVCLYNLPHSTTIVLLPSCLPYMLPYHTYPLYNLYPSTFLTCRETGQNHYHCAFFSAHACACPSPLPPSFLNTCTQQHYHTYHHALAPPFPTVPAFVSSYPPVPAMPAMPTYP